MRHPSAAAPFAVHGWTHRHLDLSSRLGEVLFGLIMVLTSTLTADVASGGKAAAHHLLYAALGCNIAWGLIDGVMYFMSCQTQRGERTRLIQAVHAAPDAAAALARIEAAVGEDVAELVGPGERPAVYRAMLEHLRGRTIRRPVVTRADLLGALACFWLVFLSCLPAAVPFLVFREPVRALRVSNALLLAMLFFVGWVWARHTGTRPLVAGLCMVGIGLGLVGVAVLLGG